ncbi:MAG TPA: hypothetical protein VN634_00815 [Candidatus Limnocylindrales bacterium]|nr:hypothetical protein [Candidatus Limnocylindrales bacterium]
MLSSKDIARRLRLAGYPGRDTFRRYYVATALVCMVSALGCWLVMHWFLGPRQYLPRPISSNHALFGDRCESCHDAFQNVTDAACLGCHSARVHAPNEVGTPQCAHCHVEHRSTDVFLSVSSNACVACHADLETSGKDAVVERRIATFAAHPEFNALREGKRDHDPARLRFNHRIHLTSDQIPENERPLGCPSCHRIDPQGRLMQPVRFATDCKRCHQQIVEGPTGSIEALHDTPEVIHEDLRRQLLDVAASIGTVTSAELRSQLDKIATPSPELLSPPHIVGRVPRPGFSKERLSVAALEKDLYKPFVAPGTDGTSPTAPLYELNKGCFLCHYEDGPREDPAAMPTDPASPRIAPTAVAARWLLRSEFSHRRHELMPCESCHPHVAESRETADTNLPDKAVCQRCHVDGARASAGAVCMSCHLYHDTSKRRDAGTLASHGNEAECGEKGNCGQGAAKRARSAPLRTQGWWEIPGGAAPK